MTGCGLPLWQKERPLVNHKVDLRKTVSMALCALLSLVVFLAFLILMTYSDRLLAVLLSNDGDGSGGLVQWVNRDRGTG
jgi:hypothetical protein